MHTYRQRRLTPLAVPCLLALAACSSSNPEPPFASGTIDSTGGTVEVAEGNLAGARVEIPEGALSEPTEITISRGFPTQVPGFLPLGRAVTLGSPGTAFAVPAVVTLPLSADPSGSNPLVMLKVNPDGSVLELGPTLRDTDNGTASAPILSFSTVWPAERQFGELATRPYIQLQFGNVWNFDQELEADIELVFDEPNLDGLVIFKLTFSTPTAEIGFYLQDDFQLGFVSLGVFNTVGDDTYQLLHDPIPFLQSSVTLGQPIESTWPYTVYAPFGVTDPTGEGRFVQRLLCTKPRQITVPAGTFEGLLVTDYQLTGTDADGTVRNLDQRFTLGVDVSFLTADILGVSAELESGTVDGDPIGDT